MSTAVCVRVSERVSECVCVCASVCVCVCEREREREKERADRPETPVGTRKQQVAHHVHVSFCTHAIRQAQVQQKVGAQHQK